MQVFSRSEVPEIAEEPSPRVVLVIGLVPDPLPDSPLPDRLSEALSARGVTAEIARQSENTLMTPIGVERLTSADATIIVFSPTGPAGMAARRAVLAASRFGRSTPVLLATEADMAAATAFLRERLPDRQPLCCTLSASADVLATTVMAAIGAGRQSQSEKCLRLWLMPDDEAAASQEIDGVLQAGAPRAGLAVALLPEAHPAVIERIDPVETDAVTGGGRSLRVRLDRPLDLRNARLLASADDRPEIADQVAAEILWSASTPLLPGRPYELRLGNQSVRAQVSALKHKIDPSDRAPVAARQLMQGEIGLCNLSFAAPILFDAFEHCPATGRFHLFDTFGAAPVGMGNILFTLRRATNIHWQSLAVNKSARAQLKDQRPSCLWFTGLSGSGKSTVASLLEKRLLAQGRHTYTLDGDNIRHGLNRDLGFTDADRVENIRRVAEVAKLFADAGLIVIVSFISPFRAERKLARDLFAEDEFIEIFVDTPIEVCESRDPKGLYRKARAGQLKNFTGIDSPYERPEDAEVHLMNASGTPEDAVDAIIAALKQRGIL
jgi:adenylyl-sulfate kinase